VSKRLGLQLHFAARHAIPSLNFISAAIFKKVALRLMGMEEIGRLVPLAQQSAKGRDHPEIPGAVLFIRTETDAKLHVVVTSGGYVFLQFFRQVRF